MSTGASPTPFSRGRPSSASAPRRWPRRASPTPSPSRRSEEGRGGEEGRSWGAADHLKKKKKQCGVRRAGLPGIDAKQAVQRHLTASDQCEQLLRVYKRHLVDDTSGVTERR